ncbi:MAG: hypothetical protein UZ07_CHB004001855 [Chlorobi bacterium OLB7]|nr:MAG: hypothetical protein UZ07_CHB004001855 [Chlorobi bacterium OLB7]
MAARLACRLLLALLVLPAAAAAQTLPGIDVLVAQNFAPVAGKRVGLVTNQTGVRRDFRQTTVEALLATDRCQLTALYAPEHGIDGSVLAGDEVANRSYRGIPVYSLYGPTKKPTPQMLKDIDVMLYDIQDIGVRSYTFISTLIKVMEGCAEANIPLIVLDRPNPIGGDVIDGEVLDTAFRSFVGMVPVPYVYGLTVGELALMANGEGWLSNGLKCELSVIQMARWNRGMRWRETGLQWIPPSPHIPTPEAGFAYAATGTLGELGIISIGIGYTLPFELVGATWMDGEDFAKRLNSLDIDGIWFRKTSYKPLYGFSNGQVCNGVQIIRSDLRTAPFTACIAIMTTLRDAYPERKLFPPDTSSKWGMFNKVCGGNRLKQQLLSGASFKTITDSWTSELNRFIGRREEYLLYE